MDHEDEIQEKSGIIETLEDGVQDIRTKNGQLQRELRVSDKQISDMYVNKEIQRKPHQVQEDSKMNFIDSSVNEVGSLKGTVSKPIFQKHQTTRNDSDPESYLDELRMKLGIVLEDGAQDEANQVKNEVACSRRSWEDERIKELENQVKSLIQVNMTKDHIIKETELRAEGDLKKSLDKLSREALSFDTMSSFFKKQKVEMIESFAEEKQSMKDGFAEEKKKLLIGFSREKAKMRGEVEKLKHLCAAQEERFSKEIANEREKQRNTSKQNSVLTEEIRSQTKEIGSLKEDVCNLSRIVFQTSTTDVQKQDIKTDGSLQKGFTRMNMSVRSSRIESNQAPTDGKDERNAKTSQGKVDELIDLNDEDNSKLLANLSLGSFEDELFGKYSPSINKAKPQQTTNNTEEMKQFSSNPIMVLFEKEGTRFDAESTTKQDSISSQGSDIESDDDDDIDVTFDDDDLGLDDIIVGIGGKQGDVFGEDDDVSGLLFDGSSPRV